MIPRIDTGDGFDVDAALQLAVMRMHIGETSELIWEPDRPAPPPEFQVNNIVLANTCWQQQIPVWPSLGDTRGRSTRR